MQGRIYKGLRKRYLATLTDGHDGDLQGMAEWMVDSLMMRVSGMTWSVYKNEFLKGCKDSDQREKLRTYFKENKPTERRERRVVKRSKELSQEKEKLLIDELLSPRRKTYGKTAAAWFKAGIATGLRPNEWVNASIVVRGGLEYLKVKNSKRVNWDDNIQKDTSERQGRVTGVHRTIPIHHLEDKTLNIIRAHLAVMDGAKKHGVSKELYESVRKTIAASVQRLWPGMEKPPTLYTARHIYRDTLKSSLRSDGLSVDAVDVIAAVLMGHGSKKSNYAYGMDSDERATGELGFNVSELADEVKAMLSVAITIYD